MMKKRERESIKKMNNILNKTNEIKEKVILMKEWKEKTEKEDQIKSINNYLQVLNFHELITEANSMINKLNTKEFDDYIVLQSNLILDEISRRLGENTKRLSV